MANGANIRELKIIAPPGFVFPTSCGNMCQADQALGSSGRRTALIASPTGEPLSDLDDPGLEIMVITPEHTPNSIAWFVEGRGQGASMATGWGEGAGFVVNPMKNSATYYPGVANLKDALISFQFTVDVPFGKQIGVVAPMGYMLTCSTQNALRQISLPGKPPECVDDPLQLILENALPVGTYSFAIKVDLPDQEPEDNTFNIEIMNLDNEIVDAAYGLPGQRIVPIGVKDPTLAWTGSDPGEETMITFGLTFTEATPNIKTVLLNFPDKFVHDVRRPTDVQNLNKRFRVAAGQDWADISNSDRLKIRLDDSDDQMTVPPGTYEWNFPAVVPCCEESEMPKVNVWHLSLCSDLACNIPGDSNIIVTFPMAGFALGEEPQGKVGTGGARRKSSIGMEVILILLLALFAPPVMAWGV
jgi:hypothetical protein